MLHLQLERSTDTVTMLPAYAKRKGENLAQDAPGEAQVVVDVEILGDEVVVLDHGCLLNTLTRMDRMGRIIREGGSVGTLYFAGNSRVMLGSWELYWSRGES
jgi:hypothetical protein